MKKNLPLFVIGFLILLAISTFIAVKYNPNIFVSTKGQAGSTSAIIFFYGNGCPHCAVVEKYIADNKIDSKISFDKKEVFDNQDNAALLADKAHSCGLNTDTIGVPFVWDGTTGKCYVGETDAINYFKGKIGQ
jgi:glutaredoxin